MNTKYKINKYLLKLKNGDIHSDKFGVHLIKLNEWYNVYEQSGGLFGKKIKLEQVPTSIIKKQPEKTLLLKIDDGKYNYCNIRYNNKYFVIIFKKSSSVPAVSNAFNKKLLNDYLNKIYQSNAQIDDYNKCLDTISSGTYIIFGITDKLSVLGNSIDIIQDELTYNYTQPENFFKQNNNFLDYINSIFSFFDATPKIGLITIDDIIEASKQATTNMYNEFY